MQTLYKTIGIAGLGAIGSAVARAHRAGRLPGLELAGAAERREDHPGFADFGLKRFSFAQLADECDLVIECLPASAVPALCEEVFARGKDILIISSAALLVHPEILGHPRRKQSRIIVPSGAIAGLDGVRAMAHLRIKSARIASTKAPRGYAGAPYVQENKINLDNIAGRELIFSGNALEAARGFPANVNVAATLSLAGIGPQATQVEIWADPDAPGNTHEITVESEFSKLSCRVENRPDPANPKSSVLAAQSIVSVLNGLQSPLALL